MTPSHPRMIPRGFFQRICAISVAVIVPAITPLVREAPVASQRRGFFLYRSELLHGSGHLTPELRLFCAFQMEAGSRQTDGVIVHPSCACDFCFSLFVP